jgi:hypothetical protein
MDDYGDDYGLRVDASPSSTVVAAVVVTRRTENHDTTQHE